MAFLPSSLRIGQQYGFIALSPGEQTSAQYVMPSESAVGANTGTVVSQSSSPPDAIARNQLPRAASCVLPKVPQPSIKDADMSQGRAQ